MSDKTNLDYIASNLSEAAEKLKATHTKVEHGKLKIQRKKIKAQVMKKHKPTDHERERICRNARKKAHTPVADAKRNISNDVRKNLKEGLQFDNRFFTLSEGFGLDFLEESCGSSIEVTFFEKPEVTSVSESLDFGKTKTGRQRKGKAIGIAEGVFAPIEDSEGNSVFSRNNRLYESNFWCYQLENANLADRVSTRRMLGTIGHYDKKVDDKDLAEGKVSHIVTDLEIREDDVNGRYLWGRLEILNTPAGKLLKEYYDMGIPMFVSSRGGGKLIDVPGKTYKMVDKTRYYCETFDVVKEPGFLEACPEYYSESCDEDIEVKEDLEQSSEALGIKEAVTTENEVSTEMNEDNNMSETKVKCNVTADDSMEEITRKILNPMAESLARLTEIVEKMHADIYENVEDAAEEAVEEAVEEPKAEEAPAEEEKAEEAPVAESEEVVEEKCDDKKEDEDKEAEKEDCEDKEEKEIKEEAEEEAPAEEVEAEPVAEEPAEEAPAEEEKVEEAPVEESVEEKTEEVEVVDEQKDPLKEPVKSAEEKAKEAEIHAKEAADEKIAKEQIDDKLLEEKEADEVVEEPAQEETPAEEEKVEEAVEEVVAESEEPKADEEPAEEKAEDEVEAPAEEKVEESAEEEAEAEPGVEEVVDYKTAYENIKSEVDDAIKTIEETTELFKDFGKRYKEVVAEADTIRRELNSYKLSEKFNVTIEQANEMLTSKSYETVEEELKEAEAQKIEDEAQAKAEQVSESIQSETVEPKAPVSRKVFSAFSADNNISESVEGKAGRKVFSWFNK